MLVANRTTWLIRVLTRSTRSLYSTDGSKLHQVPDIWVHSKKYYATSLFSKTLSHSECKSISVPKDIMYEVVSDVNAYKEFVPWCNKSIVTARTKKTAKAKLAIGFGPILEHYNSMIVFSKPTYVKAICTDGKLFNMLDCTWRFSDGNAPTNCVIHFDVEFEFRSMMHSKLARMFFNEVVRKMVSAFEARGKLKHKEYLLNKNS